MKTKIKLTKLIVTALFLFLLSGIFTVNANAAPRLYLEPSPVNLTTGVDTDIKLQIDVESNSVFGADAVINFPSSDITITSVTSGGFFSDFSYAPSSGKLEIHGYFGNSFDSKSGSGTFAIIKVKTSKNTGAGQMSFTCTGGSETEILRASDGQNILSCSALSSITMSYGTTSGGGSSNNDSGTTNNNTSDPNATNSCGGTCGSNYNCNSGLYCYSGFCRNPDCPNSTTCGCVATPKATIKASVKPKSSTAPTPQIVFLSKETSSPSATPTDETLLTEEPTTTSTKKIDIKSIGVWGGIAIIVAIVLSAIASLFKRKGNNPPTPPTTIVPPTMPVNPPTQEIPQTDTQNWQNPPTTPPSI